MNNEKILKIIAVISGILGILMLVFNFGIQVYIRNTSEYIDDKYFIVDSFYLSIYRFTSLFSGICLALFIVFIFNYMRIKKR